MKFSFTFLIGLFFYLSVFSSSFIEGEASRKSDTTVDGDFVIIHKIILLGNKITKDRIIFRELIFSEDDTIAAGTLDEKLQQSRKNLVNTSLFNFVTISYMLIEDSANLVDVTIEFIERWYVWPVPIFEFADRNFNEWLKKRDWSRLNYGVFLTWNNFRGRREKLILYARFGYDQKYELSYQIPYINRKQTWGMGFAGGLSQNHEIPYNSVDNKEVYYKSEEFYPKR
ncbi:MAG: POTRA domain-containing protein, partial [Bacteroidales bacterium]